MGKKANNADKQRSIVNRKARQRYDIVERLEAGVALLGTEVKAIRDGQVDLSAGFARMENNQVILHEVHIKPCLYGNVYNHEPRRPRRLLLHRREIHKLLGALNQKGRTLIPLAMYFNRHGKLKVELGLCQGKRLADKRETLKRKTAERETARAVAMHHGRRGG